METGLQLQQEERPEAARVLHGERREVAPPLECQGLHPHELRAADAEVLPRDQPLQELRVRLPHGAAARA
eukprot:5470918-Lingulodinium_polyedra.AAC.1